MKNCFAVLVTLFEKLVEKNLLALLILLKVFKSSHGMLILSKFLNPLKPSLLERLVCPGGASAPPYKVNGGVVYAPSCYMQVGPLQKGSSHAENRV